MLNPLPAGEMWPSELPDVVRYLKLNFVNKKELSDTSRLLKWPELLFHITGVACDIFLDQLNDPMVHSHITQKACDTVPDHLSLMWHIYRSFECPMAPFQITQMSRGRSEIT